MDILITDLLTTPIFYESAGICVVPVLPVFAVIEVKSKLDGQTLDACYENMKSVRALDKRAVLSPPTYEVRGTDRHGERFTGTFATSHRRTARTNRSGRCITSSSRSDRCPWAS